MRDMSYKRDLSFPVLLCLALALTAAVFYVQPFMTNDGPIHVTFSRFLDRTGPLSDLAFQLYRKSDPLLTNQSVYWLLSFLMPAVSPDVAESIVQAVCLVGLPLAACFALRQFGTDKTWLAVFIFPLALNHLFFLGLYNFCLSAIGFLLVIGSFLWMQKAPSLWRALLPTAALYLTFVSHAAGFIAACVALFVLTLIPCLFRFRESGRVALVLREYARHIAVLCAALAPMILMLAGGSGEEPAKYGITPLSRIFVMLRLRLIHVHSVSDMLAALVLSAILCAGVFHVGKQLYHGRRQLAQQSLQGAASAFALVIALGGLALVFPDTLGGGWTHFERMALFPALTAPFCMAFWPLAQRTRMALLSVGVLVTAVVVATAVWAQSNIARQTAPLAKVDRLVGEHCSIVPLVFGAKMAGENVNYNPFQHVVSRLEYQGDRVVLFNFLARLNVYPVHFQNGRDPQEKLFGWRRQQQDATVFGAHIAEFEKNSGLNVDYILLWGNVEAGPAALKARLPGIIGDSRLVYRSDDGQVRLLMRTPTTGTRCTSRAAAVPHPAQPFN